MNANEYHNQPINHSFFGDGEILTSLDDDDEDDDEDDESESSSEDELEDDDDDDEESSFGVFSFAKVSILPVIDVEAVSELPTSPIQYEFLIKL